MTVMYSVLSRVGGVRPRLLSASQPLVQRRCLGQAPTGRQLKSVDVSWEEAKKLFYKPALSYGEFAKRVEALRMFAFWALVSGLSLDIVLHPPQSQYWSKWNVLSMPSRLMERFGDKASAKGASVLPALGQDHMTDAAREYHRVCNL